MLHGLLYLPISTHGFKVLAMLDTGATRSLLRHYLAEKLSVTIQDILPLTSILPVGRILVATLAI